ncbi:putative undecaprenyl-phosphate N-acetylglucosaminyl 1-phosphate transferase [Sideroxyarcus emersonii]|uniref:Undecaprenyl-phosphate N-acetylglucosaminyl 1-phosphate transferase n=1 Tax=Sideroxyarcus emersonii TaxID=2764705 RepID=A0AAN1XC91_9PROT|nr:glycosyltransferase family 4 protein [Sideroxyarcus emersonii]BCK88826.1 putative undecaprenyl-phosphate N-acetylglucosaminyl 1-phosphate transferase [Sideroxyarcus emersonii]
MSHYSPIVAALVTMLLTTLILISKFGKDIPDIPNERSLHDAPVPRIGGVAIMAGLLAGWALMLTSLKWWIVLPMIGLFIISLLDDMHSLPVKKRLMAQLAAAAILVLGSGLFAQQGLAIALFVLLLTVWMTNLYNFMDGADGLSGGMALFGFSFYGVAALMNGDDTFAMMNFTIGAAALGFLYNNFHPAKVFMGDAGSIPLGFLAAGMGLWGWQQGYWLGWFPLVAFMPFVLDASVTLVKRTMRGAKVTEAHREHYYQRLIQMGWSHSKLALVEYMLMLAAGLGGLVCIKQALPWYLLLVWAGIYLILMLIIDSKWKKWRAPA